MFRISNVYLSCIYRVSIVYLSCLYRDRQQKRCCKGIAFLRYMQEGRADFCGKGKILRMDAQSINASYCARKA